MSGVHGEGAHCSKVLLAVVSAVASVQLASAQEQINLQLLFPRVKADATSTTGIAVANPTDDPAHVTFLYAGNSGLPARIPAADVRANVSIPPHTQLANEITELFPSAANREGSLVALSDNISLVGFFLTYTGGVQTIDGAEAVMLAAFPFAVVFPEVLSEPGSFTEISLSGLSDRTVAATLALYDAQGTRVQQKAILIPGNLGRYSRPITDIFDSPIPAKCYVMATSTAAGLLGYENFGTAAYLAGRNAIPANTVGRRAPTSLFGAQLVDGYGYTSEIVAANPTGLAAQVRFSAYRTGVASSEPLVTKSVTIPANGLIKENARTFLNLPAGDFVGWLRLDSDVVGVVGDVTFGDVNRQFLSSVQLQSSPLTDFVFSHLADGLGFVTGVTFLNPTPDPANVLVEVFDPAGNKTGQGSFVLQPFEHRPRVLPEIIPGFQPQVRGYIRVTSDIGIFSFELFLYLPAQRIISMSAVPPQRGNGAMSGELLPALPSSVSAAVRGLTATRPPIYQASLAKGVRLDLEAPSVPGEIVLKLSPEAPSGYESELAARMGLETRVRGADRVDLLRARTVSSPMDLLSRPELEADLAVVQRSTLQTVEALNADPHVLYAEPNYLYQPTVVPSDALYPRQWHYPLIKLPAAWEITTGSASIVAAVIDTGAKFAHPDLSGRLTGGQYDFISDPQRALDGDGMDGNAEDVGDDPRGVNNSYHGSHVAGTIGATTNTAGNVGVAGVNWISPLMTLRVLGAGGGSTYDISQAILYAAGLNNASGLKPVQRANVINMSLGGPGQSQTMRQAIQQAIAAGVHVVVSAGNENNAEPSYPAWFAAPSDDLGVICVGAIDYSLSKAPYSNFGPQITVVAPGGNTAVDFNDDGYPDGVLSTSWDQNTNQPTYLYYQGTSMAAPHVTGVVSLLMALNASLSPLQLRTILKETAIDLGAPQRDNLYGDGLIDPVAALARVATNLQLPPKLVVSSAALEFGYVQTQLTASVSNGGGGTLKVDPPTVTMQQGSGWLSAVLSGSLLTVSVSRSGLANGDYSGEIQLTSNGGAATIKVAMKVGSGSAGDVGTVYIIAVDPRTFDTVGQTSIGLAQQYKFTILPIPTGNYLVVGGTDKDKDFIICEKEDYCGLYPVSNQPSEVKVELNKNTTNVNFVLEKPVTPTSSWGDLKLRIPAEGFDRLWDEVSPVVLQGILQRMLGGSASR